MAKIKLETTSNKNKSPLSRVKHLYNNSNYLEVFSIYNELLNNKKTNIKILLQVQFFLAKIYHRLKQYNDCDLELYKIMKNNNFKLLSITDKIDILLLRAVCVAKLKNKKQLAINCTEKSTIVALNNVNSLYLPLIFSEKPSSELTEKYFNFIKESKNKNKNSVENKIYSNVYLNVLVLENILKNTQNQKAYLLLDEYIKNSKSKSALAVLHNTALVAYRKQNLNKFLEHYDELAKLPNDDVKINKQYIKCLQKSMKLSSELDNLVKDYYNDELTGTLNLKALKKYEASIKNSYGAIIYFDLNFLKTINDNHGHAVGDQYLKQFSKILLDIKKDSDPVIRVGGDEFVMICLNYTQENIEEFMKKLAQKALKPINVNNKSFMISYSAGVTMFNNPRTSLNKLIDRADKAMYRAKKEYKTNHYSFY